MVIVVSGMIAVGKSSVAELIGKGMGLNVHYESVDDNPILPLFYNSTAEEKERHRYPFLLQLHFLHTRFASIKDAIADGQAILDRSIYEDHYFAKVNHELGQISSLELEVYEGILKTMMAEIEEIPKKAPDLNIYLKASFDTVLERIGLRGRGFEQDAGLIDYYHKLWSGYDAWLQEEYCSSDVLIVDMDKRDVVNNPADAEWLLNEVEQKVKTVEFQQAG